MKNWKTTTGGVIAVIMAVCAIVKGLVDGAPIDWTTSIAAISAGIGLIMAKDSNVTGGTVQQ